LESGIVGIALQISKARRAALEEMKEALRENDVEGVVRCANVLCGIRQKKQVKKGAKGERRERLRLAANG
jgi:hypothetical protein